MRILALVALLCANIVVAKTRVLTGADQILDQNHINLLIGKKVGVIAHYASRNSNGKHLVDLLHEDQRVSLKTIFSPEHGFRGLGDSSIPDSIDPQTGLPIVSLYGPRKAPEPKHLKNLDVLILDLQDVGVRYYTYATTMAYAMKAARDSGVSIIVLDRPNPIGGEIVDGAVLEEDLRGYFEAYYPVATRHGMTMGELARLYNQSFGINAPLEVIELKNWNRKMLWPETGLKWIAPSPALPSFEQALLYSTFGAMETYPLAVGRGSDNSKAFRIFGAPWLTNSKARKLVHNLNQLGLQGLSFQYVEWIPDRREYKGELCRGFEVKLNGGNLTNGLETFLKVSQELKTNLESQLTVRRTSRAIGSIWLSEGIEKLRPVEELLRQVEIGQKEFITQREAALIY